jgi:adenylate kinases
MNLLIMGVAGSGKGTMSKKISEVYHIPHVSTGDLFRQAMKDRSGLGLMAEAYINEGHLVPDEITIAMMEERLNKEDCKKGYLLDGYPRTLNQAHAFEDIAHMIGRPVQKVINLTVALDILTSRITGRRVCKVCGSIYHIEHSPSKVEGVCDRCGGELVHRSDDTVEQLAVRLKEHVLLTKPVLDYYRENGLVVDIDASADIEQVWADIQKVLVEIHD